VRNGVRATVSVLLGAGTPLAWMHSTRARLCAAPAETSL
jgi:hypothetical protein